MKNNYLVALISLTLLSLGLYNQEQGHDEFAQWKLKHNKLYSGIEDSYRSQIFHENLKLVNEHNQRHAQGLESFTITTNLFADLTFEEFSSLYLYSTYPDKNVKQHVKNSDSPNKYEVRAGIPETWDWSSQIVSPDIYSVYQQGHCLASWAFAVAGSIEISDFIAGYVQRSPQQLIDCVPQTNPCMGGVVHDTWVWAKDNSVNAEIDYSYKATKGASCTTIIPGDLYQIPKYVEKDGPFAAHVDYYGAIHDDQQGNAALVSPISVSNILFQLYHTGVYDKGCDTPLNYDALVVGYDARTDQPVPPFYKLKMSWSGTYGESGFIRIAMDNECVYAKYSYAARS